MLPTSSQEKKPFNTGYLPENKGHKVYYHEFGNPEGLPILVFHGGPGSCSKPKHANMFNLKNNRVILFDQRGRGKSLPLFEVQNNTLQDVVEDAKKILETLSVKKAIVYGGSWGSTVGLVFAQTYPDLVDKLIVAKTFLGRKKDIDWRSSGVAHFYPDIIQKLMDEVSPSVDIRKYYADLAFSSNEDDRIKATSLYGRYEPMIGQLNPTFPNEPASEEHSKSFKLRMHYERNNYGLCENQILKNIKSIENIPTLIVHNRLDMVCPVEQSWELHSAMKKSKLVMVPDYGHDSDLLDETLEKEIVIFMKDK